MTPSTSESWSGLPIHARRHVERLRAVDIDIPVPTLVLWNNSDAVIDVRQTARQQWHFRTRANHFDLYAAGRFDAIVASESTRDKLVLALPPLLTSELMGEDEVDLALEHCRFQFADRTLERLVRRLDAHARESEPFGPLYTQSLSVAILVRLAALASRGPRLKQTRPLPGATRRLLLELIEGKIAAPPHVDEMALLSGMATGEFLKAFRLTFGLTPHQFLLERRMARAKSLLLDDKPLTTLALELGFASHAHFTATFRTRTGVTPSQYRRNASQRDSESVELSHSQ